MRSITGRVQSGFHWSRSRAVLIHAMVGCANPAKGLLRDAQYMLGEDAEVASEYICWNGWV
jgi:hypothetical protein